MVQGLEGGFFLDKCYLVVGGSSGIGFACSQLLAGSGAKVIICSHDAKKQSCALGQLEGNGHFGIVSDLRDPDAPDEIFAAIRNRSILLDGFVFCSGIAPLCMLGDNTAELMTEVFQVNLFSFIELMRCFQNAAHSATGSRVVAVSSVTAHASGNRQVLYGSSKAAMIAAVRLMAIELLQRDIRINCVSPGSTETPMLAELRAGSRNLDERLKSTQPLGIIDPSAIARTIIHLLAEGSDYMTGNEIIVDGGHLL